MLALRGFSQKSKLTFGFCYKPIFPSNFFRTGPINFSNNEINYEIIQRSGFSAGAIVRKTINKSFSIETGILFTKRNYDLSIQDTSFIDKSDFKIIGYEIPVSALVFIQLGKQLYMSTALGGSIDIFPSDISTYDPKDHYYLTYSARTNKVNAGIVANLGAEYRTKKSGTIYLGFNYHRSFSSIYTTAIEYYPERNFNILPTSKAKTTLQGDYFTIDLRYYFHDEVKKKSYLQD